MARFGGGRASWGRIRCLCGSDEAWRDRWRWRWLLAVKVSGFRIWAHGRRIRLRRPDPVLMTDIGGTGMARGDLARARWLDFQAVAAAPLPLNLAYRVGLGGSGRGMPEATGGGQQRRRRTPEPAVAVCSDLDVRLCCVGPDL
jgi:hypothetical protein